MPINIFCCYAHEDEALLKKLKSHMRMLQRQGLIHIWHDQDITAGTEREQAISKHLDEAQIILLLVSPDFINSEYCYSTEMQRAMVRYEAGTAHVIPIMLRPTDRRGTPFEKLQPLPSESKPVTSWRNRDEAFLAITQGIRKAVEQLHSPEESSEPFAAEKNTSKPNLRLKKEELTALSNSTASTAVLYIPLLAESLVIDSHQLKKNLQNLYDCDVKEVKVQIDMFEFSANLSEIVEKFCREIETDEIKFAADQRSLLLKHFKDRSELWPICFPLYEANLTTLLSKLVERIFSTYRNPLERLTIARESLENTLEYIRYRLTAYLRNVVPSSLAYQYGFFTIARYLEKYEKLGFDPEGVQKVLEEIYRYQNIFVNTSERVYIVESKKKNAPFWQVYFPHLNEDDKMAIMFNCQPSSVIDGYTWDVFFLPQIIGETLMNTSFGEGKRIEAFSYKIGFNMNDYEYLGFP